MKFRHFSALSMLVAGGLVMIALHGAAAQAPPPPPNQAAPPPPAPAQAAPAATPAKSTTAAEPGCTSAACGYTASALTAAGGRATSIRCTGKREACGHAH